jgi:hypothetical protein
MLKSIYYMDQSLNKNDVIVFKDHPRKHLLHEIKYFNLICIAFPI